MSGLSVDVGICASSDAWAMKFEQEYTRFVYEIVETDISRSYVVERFTVAGIAG
jgi:hypothetical protein